MDEGKEAGPHLHCGVWLVFTGRVCGVSDLPPNVIDFAAWKAKKAQEEFKSWARKLAMEYDLQIDFEDPDFWDEVEEMIKEEYND